MAMLKSRLSNKLRLSTLVLLVFVLLGSLLAYLKMRQVSRLSEAVATARIPALSAVRDLHVAELGELSALQSYVLFGADPAMARRYGAELHGYHIRALVALGDIERSRATYDSLVGAETMETLLNHYRAFGKAATQVQELAVGHGSDGTGKAFDLLQGPTAQANADFLNSVTEVVGKLVAATSQDLTSVVEINRREAMHLWLFIFLGGLFGVGMSEITMRRVVRSILRVAERAQTIAEGDLTGEPMHMDSNDEVTSLAGSINRMQENLREMIRTMMEISGI
ncbi:MAG TPA: HAMP domain-containing protein, partial [Steroidobacteraceae bacterium]|nr:HAMP domain-containing protein [Steroidobacteraceae bacterium]